MPVPSPPPAGGYTVNFTLAATEAMRALPPAVSEQIREHVNEIAVVAEAFPSPAADQLQSKLHFEVAGQVVRYVVHDAERALTVMSVASAGSE